MANEKKLVIFDNWIQPAAYLSKEDQQEYYGLLCMHLMYGNVKAEDGSNKSIQMLLEMILPLVDLAKKNYEIRSAAGKMGGRPKKVTDELVWRYVQNKQIQDG